MDLMRAVEKRLRERIKILESELAEVKEDREGFRNSFAFLFRESIRIHGTECTWNMASLIETLAKSMAKRKYWYW